ncbi:MAG: hypothetical protein U0572_07010 [Phycisphaerales bacterium]
MQCNIDAKGKLVRLFGGIVIDAVGVTLLALWLLGILPTWAAVVGGIATISGAFMIFEGAAGWCALRAMGMKTPL